MYSESSEKYLPVNQVHLLTLEYVAVLGSLHIEKSRFFQLFFLLLLLLLLFPYITISAIENHSRRPGY